MFEQNKLAVWRCVLGVGFDCQREKVEVGKNIDRNIYIT